MKYAICNETFQGWNWAETCRTVGELGYTGIEIAPFTLAEDVRTLSQQSRNSFARIAQNEGLEIVGLHWLLVSPKGLSLTDEDEHIRNNTSSYLAALVDFCSDLGGKIMVLGSPAQRRLPKTSDEMPGTASAIAAIRLQECLHSALQRTELHNVTLCLEPLPAPEADFILNLKEARALVDRIQHPNLKTIFDVKSASSEGIALPSLIYEFAPLISHVHANDVNRRGPGFGTTDFVPILSALHEVNYAGYVSVEVFDYSPDPVTIARESLRYMRRCEYSHAT